MNPTPANPGTSWLALDVGGANIKAAHSSGQARVLPFEVWKRPGDLGKVIATLASTFPPFAGVALTMTAELCDCYPTKSHGVSAVLDSVLQALPGHVVRIWGRDEEFHSVDEIHARTDLAAAANWLALALVAARLLPAGEGLLIDIGSTTTDLIPLRDMRVATQSRTDTERLQTGELVYAGVRRTPFCALATELPFRGAVTGLSAELFASTHDVYLTLGDIPPDPKDLATADGRPATLDAARDRLARMVGADRETFSANDARSLSFAADSALVARLASAAQRACAATIGLPRGAVVAGSGEFLARRVAQRVIDLGAPIVSLNQAWGPVTSGAGCAHALAVLAAERNGELATPAQR
ncbi:MAG TPA: hydantoinase/oxoprolinase family protein [Isosphaeraceae bacterium]|nr:hydantoinase/oxoprolinase family protein [Isosphaeraceae bacterium]